MAEKQMKAGLLSEPSTMKVIGKKQEAMSATKLDKDPATKPAELINRNSHPVTLSYNGEALIINPRERVRINNVGKLGGLCVGVLLNNLK